MLVVGLEIVDFVLDFEVTLVDEVDVDFILAILIGTNSKTSESGLLLQQAETYLALDRSVSVQERRAADRLESGI